MKTPEDEAFEFVERMAKRNETQFTPDINPYETVVRNATIDEIANALARFKGAFGEDTVDSFAIFIRGMKR